MPVEHGAECAEALRDREEDRDGLGADLQREDLADGQVGRAGSRRGEEEDDAPRDRLGGSGQHPLVEQVRGDRQHRPGQDVGARDHLLAADGVEEVPDRQRAEQVPDREGDQVERRVRGVDVVELRQHQGVGEEDRVVQERLGDHQRGAQRGPGPVLREQDPDHGEVAGPLHRPHLQDLVVTDRGQCPAGRLHLVLDAHDRGLGLGGPAVHELPARALRQVAPDEQDHHRQHRPQQEAEPPAHARRQHVQQEQRAQRADDDAAPVSAVDRDVHPPAVAGRDQLVDRGVDGRVLPADTHARDEPGREQEQYPAAARP
jgi:hypothetical protein